MTQLQETENWCGWQPETVEHKNEFMKKVMENDAHRFDVHVTTIHKTIEFAAGCVALCTEAERDNFFQKKQMV